MIRSLTQHNYGNTGELPVITSRVVLLSNNKKMETMEKMTLDKRSLREIYFSMDNTPPKKAFIQRIAKATKRSESAVRCWISNAYEPDDLAKEKLEQELGVPANVLFPGNKGEKAV